MTDKEMECTVLLLALCYVMCERFALFVSCELLMQLQCQ